MDKQIVELLQKGQGRLTRAQLWEMLQLPEAIPTDEYWAAEQKLIDEQRIERRRGRNGGIYLLPFDEPKRKSDAESIATALAAEQIKAEIGFYQPVIEQIRAHWTEQPGFTHAFAHVTAMQGRRRTGGRWSRPDIVVCTVSDWHFSSRPEGDVRSIEVKRFEALDVMAVYEAVSHRARAHYAYLLIVNYPKEPNDEAKAVMETVLATAGKHGVGVITAVDANDWGTWEFEIDPTRSDADNQAVHQMLLDSVPPEVRDPFRSALRTVNVQVNV